MPAGVGMRVVVGSAMGAASYVILVSVDPRRDGTYLRERQYVTSANLSTRIAIHERFSVARQGWHEWIFDTMALRDGTRVLEVGAGAATLWSTNAPRVPSLELVLTDLSDGMLRDAQRAIGAVGGRGGVGGLASTLRWAVADVQRLPFPDARFDVVVANAMLYHVPDLARAVAELRRVTRPGGVLYAATFGAAHLRELYELVAPYRDGHPSLDSFSLETGPEVLAGAFDAVDVRRYDDALVITEAVPLLAYLDSMIGADAFPATARVALHAEAARLVARDGGWRVTKDGGLLVAR